MWGNEQTRVLAVPGMCFASSPGFSLYHLFVEQPSTSFVNRDYADASLMHFWKISPCISQYESVCMCGCVREKESEGEIVTLINNQGPSSRPRLFHCLSLTSRSRCGERRREHPLLWPRTEIRDDVHSRKVWDYIHVPGLHRLAD